MNTVKQCGFDIVEGLYIENLVWDGDEFNNYSDGTFSHNMEWITEEAIKVINEDSEEVRQCTCPSLSKQFYQHFTNTNVGASFNGAAVFHVL